jgi:hypothetical protein
MRRRARLGEHARCGIPITLLSFAAALVWFAFRA